MPTIRPGEGFTIDQVLNGGGFTLDTGEFESLAEDEYDSVDHIKTAHLNSEEITKFMSSIDDTEDIKELELESPSFIGSSFDAIRSNMHSIYGDGKVMKFITTKGTGEIVPEDAQITVQYVGYFEFQEEPFDSTFYSRDKRMILRLGKGTIIPGLEIAIRSMKKFEKALFLIDPCLAYGELGCMPRIPPNAEVLFKVDLVDYIDNGQADAYNDLSNEDKKKFPCIQKIVRDLLTTAKDNFSRNKTKQAMREYSRAVHYLETAHLENDTEEKEMNKLLTRALKNLTICYNKLGKPKLACSAFQKMPIKNEAIVFYQYGKALKQLGEYEEAMKALQTANRLCSSSDEILSVIREVEESRQKYLDMTKRFAQNSLGFSNNNKNDGFENVAREMCANFSAEANLMKQQLPDGLSVQEQDCIKRVAATFNLTITKLERRGEEYLYLTKKIYQ